jgi:hypothetical protein
MLIITYIGGILVPSRHCSILIETPLVGKARWENDLSIALMGSTNSKFNQRRLYLELKFFVLRLVKTQMVKFAVH